MYNSIEQFIQTIINYKFNNKSLLLKAITHASYTKQSIVGNNQILELLGDSVLGLIITNELINRFPNFNEGQISIKKSRLVSNKKLAKLSSHLYLNKYILLGKSEKKSNGHNKKSIKANVMESIIGALYIDGGLEIATKFIKQVYKQELS